MQRSRVITVGDRDITVKELSVAQVRDLMEGLEGQNLSTIDLLFPDSLPAVAVSGSTGISVGKLEADFAPSELKQIIEGVENLNPFFANMMQRLSKIGETILKEKSSIPPVAD